MTQKSTSFDFPEPSEKVQIAPRLQARPYTLIEPLYEDTFLPKRATEHSAGHDVCVNLRTAVRTPAGTKITVPEFAGRVPSRQLIIYQNETYLVGLGFKAQVPPGFYAQLQLRSSIAFKKGLLMPNSPGIIDADFPDEWMIMLRNPNRDPVAIDHGERIAQFILLPFATAPFWLCDVGVTTDRKGGFGSTN